MTRLLFDRARPDRHRRRRAVMLAAAVAVLGAAVALLCSARLRDAAARRLAPLGLGGAGPGPGALLKSPRGGRTVDSVMAEIGPETEQRWRMALVAVGVDWPPRAVTLLGLKDEKRVEVWVDEGSRWVHVRDYPVLGASGGPGPKLREGDRQVPEGVYRIEGLNPNSRYHLSMKLDYPSAVDRERAARDGRTNLGGDIFIHGCDGSIGCLAMGDPAIEELFALVEFAGRSNVRVIIVPNDIRGGRPALRPAEAPSWLDALHADLRRAVAPLQK